LAPFHTEAALVMTSDQVFGSRDFVGVHPRWRCSTREHRRGVLRRSRLGKPPVAQPPFV